MKALFVHSVRFVRTPDGRVFSEGQFSYAGWGRYLKYFDELIVVGRMSEREEAPVKWNLSSGPRITFIGTPDDHGKPLMQLQNGPSRRIIQGALGNCDALIVRQSILGWLAAEEAQRRGIPWAVEVVCSAWNSYWNYGTVLGKLYAPIAEWNSRRWIRRAEFVRYVTKRYLQELYPSKGLSVDVSDVWIKPLLEENEKIARLSQAYDEKKIVVIGLIGTLVNRYKGLHVALHAIRRLKAQGIKVHLRVLGNGYLDRWHKEAQDIGVADQLFLDGSLPSGDPVMKWLDGLDIYIQPSLTEGLPRGLIEAMGRALPALGSSCGGIPELLPAECLHRPGDDKTFAKQLARMIQDRSWRTQQAQRNFAEAKYYYADRIAAKYEMFWGQFVSHAKK